MGRSKGVGIAFDVDNNGGSMTAGSRTSERTTNPIDFEGAHEGYGRWQNNEIEWSFGPRRQRIVSPDSSPTIDPIASSANPAESSTSHPQEVNTPPESQALILERSGYGKRAFHALYHWEGVVERVEKKTFQCRIVPLVYGSTDATKVELTEFSFDDLATESDQSLVLPGAIFYWTVGRSRNAAGTVTNLSLVRFRRLPPPTRVQASLAEQEADDLLRVVGDGDGSASAGG